MKIQLHKFTAGLFLKHRPSVPPPPTLVTVLPPPDFFRWVVHRTWARWVMGETNQGVLCSNMSIFVSILLVWQNAAPLQKPRQRRAIATSSPPPPQSPPPQSPPPRHRSRARLVSSATCSNLCPSPPDNRHRPGWTSASSTHGCKWDITFNCLSNLSSPDWIQTSFSSFSFSFYLFDTAAAHVTQITNTVNLNGGHSIAPKTTSANAASASP